MKRILLIIAGLLLVGCSAAPTARLPDVGTPIAQATAPPPSATATPDPLKGVVLGATKSSWVAAKGQPGGSPIRGYERFGPNLDVIYGVGADGEERVRHVEMVFDREEPLARARDQAKALHPRDSRSQRTYIARAGQTVEVFSSAGLADAFAGIPVFHDEEPGTYIQIADRGQPTTRRVVIAIGNNP